MTISINDLKIYESEVMSNAANGGGGMTSNVIIDGASNNIFDDVSEPDRAYGKVNQRKLFMACKSVNSDKLFSALTYISKLPPDEKINVNLVESENYFDTLSNRVINTKDSIVSTLHDSTTVVTPPTYISADFKKFNLDSASSLFPSDYHLNLPNSSFDAFLDGTQSAGSTTLKVFGFDGCMNEAVYGTDGLSLFFKNNFFLKNVSAGTSEVISVTNVQITSYIDPDITTTSYSTAAASPDYLAGENGALYATASPKKKFFATLTLSTPLTNTYAGATSSDKTTWLSSVDAVHFWAISSIGGTTVNPAYSTYSTINTKKIFTAKKITASLSSNATAITVANNDNAVIPSVNGIILSDTILGVTSADFADGYIDKEIIGHWKKGETVTLPEQSLISIKVDYLYGGAWTAMNSTWYLANATQGTVVFDSNTFYASFEKYRITYRVKSPRKAFLSGDVVAIINDVDTIGTYSASQTVTLTRQNLAKISVRDSAKNLIDESKFTTDLTAGTITFTSVSGLSQPLTITDRIEDFGLIQSVTDNVLNLYKPITHAFPVTGTVVSNCMMHGDIQATASGLFDQQTWTNVWSDTLIGSSTTAQFNQIDYPIVVSNHDTPTERWILLFKTATTFDLIGEHLGVIASNQSISVNLAPLNPHTAQPYFTIAANGFGGGWAAGNVIRFNTYSASAPFWVVQTIAQGTATDPDFNFAIEVRGDIDAL